MVSIDCIIFGYRKLKIDPSDLSIMTSLLLRSGIPSKFESDGTIIIRERDFSLIQALIKGRVEFGVSEGRGIFCKLKDLKHKPTIFTAIIISVIISVFLSGLVWDIRIEGNVDIPSSRIIYELSRCDFNIGDLWSLIDRSDVETKMLLSYDEIAWININRRGTVAYVSVIEKPFVENQGQQVTPQYANIVADVDCIIEEITVVNGYAVVKPGDVVKKGDLLISGTIPNDAGGGFCCAQGRVVGRISERVSADVEKNFTLSTVKEKKLYSVDIKIFNFFINIFKLYGNLTNEYDIIETKRSNSLLGAHKLPFSLITSYVPVYSTEQIAYSDHELVSVASARLNALIASRLQACDLLKMKTYGSFTDTGYEMYSDLIYCAEIGRSVTFTVD